MNTPKPLRPLVVLAALSAACASPQRPAAAPAAAATPSAPAAGTGETPEQVIARLLSPEGTGALTPQRIDLPDGSLHVTGHGTAAATVTHEGEQHQIALPIGGAEPVRCVVFREGIDLANGVRRVFEAMRHENANIELHGMNAGFVGDTPFLDLQALYVVGPAERRALGHVKVRAFNVGERGLVCIHDEPGFVDTFDRATRPLMEAPARSPRPARYVMSFDGHPCGWTVINASTAANVTTEINMSAYLLARSAQDLVATDEVDVDRYNRAGEVAESRIVRNNNAEESSYTVRRSGTTSRYHVEGRHLGRDIAGDFTAATALLADTPAIARAWRVLTGARAPASLDVAAYESGDPLAASTQTYRLERAVDAQHAWIVEHANSADVRMLVGASGLPDEIALDVAGHALTFRRVTE